MTEQTPLGRMIGYCGRLGKLYLDMRLRQSKYNVTPVQSRALLYLSKICGEREVMQRDLERELHLKASTVNGIVDRLEEKGFIARRQSTEDGRRRLISLTAQGQAVTETFRTALEETDRAFCAVLSPEEQEQLRNMLTRLIVNLEEEVQHA